MESKMTTTTSTTAVNSCSPSVLKHEDETQIGSLANDLESFSLKDDPPPPPTTTSSSSSSSSTSQIEASNNEINNNNAATNDNKNKDENEATTTTIANDDDDDDEINESDNHIANQCSNNNSNNNNSDNNNINNNTSSSNEMSSSKSSNNNDNNNVPKFGIPIPNRVFVGGIPDDVTDHDVRELFAQYGDIFSVKIITDRAGVSKGYGFVTYKNDEDAQKVIKEADNLTIKNRKLNVSTAVMKQQHYYPEPRILHGAPGTFIYPTMAPYPTANSAAANYNQFYDNYHGYCAAEGLPLYQVAGMNGHFISNCSSALLASPTQYMAAAQTAYQNPAATNYLATAAASYHNVSPTTAAQSASIQMTGGVPQQHQLQLTSYNAPSQHVNSQAHLLPTNAAAATHTYQYATNSSLPLNGNTAAATIPAGSRYSLVPANSAQSPQSSQQYISYANNVSSAVVNNPHLHHQHMQQTITSDMHPNSNNVMNNAPQTMNSNTVNGTVVGNSSSMMHQVPMRHANHQSPSSSSLYTTYPSTTMVAGHPLASSNPNPLQHLKTTDASNTIEMIDNNNLPNGGLMNPCGLLSTNASTGLATATGAVHLTNDGGYSHHHLAPPNHMLAVNDMISWQTNGAVANLPSYGPSTINNGMLTGNNGGNGGGGGNGNTNHTKSNNRSLNINSKSSPPNSLANQNTTAHNSTLKSSHGYNNNGNNLNQTGNINAINTQQQQNQNCQLSNETKSVSNTSRSSYNNNNNYHSSYIATSHHHNKKIYNGNNNGNANNSNNNYNGTNHTKKINNGNNNILGGNQYNSNNRHQMDSEHYPVAAERPKNHHHYHHPHPHHHHHNQKYNHMNPYSNSRLNHGHTMVTNNNYYYYNNSITSPYAAPNQTLITKTINGVQIYALALNTDGSASTMVSNGVGGGVGPEPAPIIHSPPLTVSGGGGVAATNNNQTTAAGTICRI